MQTPISQKMPVEIVSIENAFSCRPVSRRARKRRKRGWWQCLQQPAVTPFTTFPGTAWEAVTVFQKTPGEHRFAPAIPVLQRSPKLSTAVETGHPWSAPGCPAPARSAEMKPLEKYGDPILRLPLELTLLHISAKPLTTCCPIQVQ